MAENAQAPDDTEYAVDTLGIDRLTICDEIPRRGIALIEDPSDDAPFDLVFV